MIVVTGAAGFIGSCLISELNKVGFKDIIAVDSFTNPVKNRNLIGKHILHKVERDIFFPWVRNFKKDIEYFFHLGARTDTLQTSSGQFDRLNFNYSKEVWTFCTEVRIPLTYASSAATYGDGRFGFSEDQETTGRLIPLNKYAQSKHQFDLWALHQDEKPPIWNGLKFFNVFGPNEYHKGAMASMVYQTYLQIKKTGTMKLFKSHRKDYEHGTQLRDFIYVKDVLNLCLELVNSPQNIGLLNVGTGYPINFNYLVKCVFKAINTSENITYIDMPLEIRNKYQYVTKACTTKFTNRITHSVSKHLDKPIDEYINEYLEYSKYY